MSMTIGGLLAQLKRANPDSQVFFDFARLVPTVVSSWRGIYSEPALGWGELGYGDGKISKAPTVAELIAALNEAISGFEYSGWKGGKYRYTERSPLHIDKIGECTNTEIASVRLPSYEEGFVVIKTEFEE
jgi:hypothetical protein